MSGFETRAIHDGQEPDPQTGAVVQPVHFATTFKQDAVGEMRAGYDYGRAGTPTRSSLETTISSLENAKHGYAFSSGLAAIDAVLRLIGPNDHVILPNDVYGGSFRLIDKIHAPHGLQYSTVDMSNAAAIEDVWRPETKMVWIETPTNPALAIIDIEAVVAIAHEHNALVVVDNTFASPYLQLPLDLGADIVVHSITKYLNGHSDVVGGFVALNDDELAERTYFFQKAIGAMLSPFDCFLTQRGLKTLAIRMERSTDNAEAIVEMLSDHPAVTKVLYPGLASHPNHDVATKQMKRYGAMISFVVAGGEEAAKNVVKSTSVFTLAESLGAVESLIEHPHGMTHIGSQGTDVAVDPGLIRLSVGIETIDDLVADLRSALDDVNA